MLIWMEVGLSMIGRVTYIESGKRHGVQGVEK